MIKSKLNIAFIVSIFPETSQTFITTQITDLIDKGHEVHIFSFDENKKAVKHQQLLDYNLLEKTSFPTEARRISKNNYYRFSKFIFRNINTINFRRFFKKYNFFEYQKKSFTIDVFLENEWILKLGSFDIIHAHFGPNGAHIAYLKTLGFFANSKLVTTFHGYDLTPETIEKFKVEYKKLFSVVDVLTVNTEYSKKLLQQITNRDIEILPVGLDTLKFKKRIIQKPNGFQILFVGRLVELKAPDLAIEILKSLIFRGHKNIRLLVVGEGEMKSHLVALAKNYELEKNIQFTGALSQEEIIKHMEESHAFIMPGIYDNSRRAETQGLVIQEAQAMELPVLISDVGGMKFGVIDGETGFVLKEKDLNAFVKKVELLIQDENLARAMGKKGREFVIQNYDSKVLGAKLEKLYFESYEGYYEKKNFYKSSINKK